MRGPESRSRWGIILDILRATSEGEGRAKKTRIMQYALCIPGLAEVSEAFWLSPGPGFYRRS